ncbi:MAG: V-type ATP synthase subunit E [Candidatus Bathyarchaeota archaeon]|nr:V-type ATP synthase subunit E [Candidatus Bathyarchaeota archaeon]
MSVKNGISAIATQILGDVQKESEAVIAAAETQAKETLKQAKAEAEKAYAKTIAQANIKADAEQRRIASLTEVEMRNRLLTAKEEMVNEAFQKALGSLTDFVKTKKYQTYLLKQIEESSQKIGSKNLIVQVSAQDKEWLVQEKLEHLSKKLNLNLQLSKESIGCLGGCIIQAEDGKIVWDNTLDHRLEELKPVLRVEVAKILFAKEDPKLAS